jgi:hypothetical protein
MRRFASSFDCFASPQMTDPLPMPTQRELATAHESRARIIAQLHEQAIVTANDLTGRHKAIGAEIAKAARWRQGWSLAVVVGTVLLVLGCIFAGGLTFALALWIPAPWTESEPLSDDTEPAPSAGHGVTRVESE